MSCQFHAFTRQDTSRNDLGWKTQSMCFEQFDTQTFSRCTSWSVKALWNECSCPLCLPNIRRLLGCCGLLRAVAQQTRRICRSRTHQARSERIPFPPRFSWTTVSGMSHGQQRRTPAGLAELKRRRFWMCTEVAQGFLHCQSSPQLRGREKNNWL